MFLLPLFLPVRVMLRTVLLENPCDFPLLVLKHVLLIGLPNPLYLSLNLPLLILQLLSNPHYNSLLSLHLLIKNILVPLNLLMECLCKFLLLPLHLDLIFLQTIFILTSLLLYYLLLHLQLFI
jgi:hypothetical protein